jgi:hypothetical protein
MSTLRHLLRSPVTAFVTATLGLGLASCSSGAGGPPGMTWDSIKPLPDFGGWWSWQYTDEYRGIGPDGKPTGLPQMLQKAPLKPEIIKYLVEVLSKVDQATSDRKEFFGAIDACLPAFFLGVTGGPFNQFEILLTPGRVTIADEMNLVRRIALGQTIPLDVQESNAGTAVGHWEGDTLVVETTGIDHRRTLIARQFPVGKGVHVVERIRLKSPDLLEIAVELTAPEILAEPFKDTYFYKRDRTHEFMSQSSCAETDRSIDHVAGKEQLDLTPPEDLPPPPSN